MRKFPGIGVEV